MTISAQPDPPTEPASTGGLLVRLAVLAIELVVFAATVTVIWQHIDPPTPPGSCELIPADLGAAVGVSGPAPVYFIDDDDHSLHCEWTVQDVPDEVDVTIWSPALWSEDASLAERRNSVEISHEVHPVPALGEGAFSAEEPMGTTLNGVSAARAGAYVVMVEVVDGDPMAYDAEDLALELAARVVASLKELD